MKKYLIEVGKGKDGSIFVYGKKEIRAVKKGKWQGAWKWIITSGGRQKTIYLMNRKQLREEIKKLLKNHEI